MVKARVARVVARRRTWMVAGCVLVVAPISLSVALAQSGAKSAALSAPSPADVQAAQKVGRDAAEKHERVRRDPAARAERDASQTRFGDLSAQDAVAVARDEAPDVMRRRRARVLTLDPGQRVKGFVDTNTALIDSGGAADALVTSPVAMLAQRRGGGWAIADLTLELDGEEFVPRNPQARVRISRRLDQGVTFERSGWGVRTTNRPVNAQLVQNKAFAANAVGHDTDVVIEPVAGGVEVSHLLRSARSPEALGLRIDVPAGGSLAFDGAASVAAAHRAVQVRDKDDKVVGTISAPVAIDAQGTAVKAALRIAGDSVFIDVPHADEDLAYPITVDPFIQEDFRFWQAGVPGSQPGRDFVGWNFVQVRNGSFDYAALEGYGLTTRVVPFPHIAFFDIGAWQWTAPGARDGGPASDGTYIFKADFGPFGLSTQPPNQPCVQLGIYKPDASPEPTLATRIATAGAQMVDGVHWQCGPHSNQYRVACTDRAQCDIPGTHTTNGTVGNHAGFRLYAGNNPSNGLALLGGSLIFYRDKAPPRLAAPVVDSGSGWIDTVPGSATAADYGVGLGKIVVVGAPAGAPAWTDTSEAYCVYPTANEYDPAEPGKRGKCATTRTHAFSTASAPEGDYPIAAIAQDIVSNNAQSASTRIRVDKTPPDVSASGPLWENRTKDFAEGPYSLTVNTADAFAGVRSLELLIDGVRKKPEHFAEQACATGGCSLNRTFSVDTLDNGTHTVRLVAYDHIDQTRTSQAFIDAKHKTIKEWTIKVDRPVLRLINRAKLGLEDFYQYDSTPTGAGSAAHVNLANGNLVWHKLPVVNPGRGLSSVVNLSYNSHDTSGLLGDLLSVSPPIGPNTNDLSGFSYGEAGRGFSLGISGLTRLNEPLSGVTTSQLPIPEILGGLLTPLLPVISPITDLATKISFTDPDGTQQTFTKRSDGTYDHPPGVNLQLRRFATEISLTETKAWAMTRPDGVTYYFDSLGYATSIEDRNANVITFNYKFYNPQTGGACLVELVDGVLCTKRVDQVVDPGSRTIDIRYRTPQLLGGLPNFGLPIPVGKKPGAVDRIIDHRALAPATRRVTKFDYDTDGYLTTLTEGLKENGAAATATTDETRTTRFAYTDAGASANRQLSQVIDPKSQTTKIEYVAPNDPYQLIGGTGAPVKSVTNRRNFTTGYTFANATDATTTTVKDPLNRTTTYTLDLSGRMTQMVDPRPATLKLEWNARNNVEKMTAAAGTPDEAITTMTYNTNGLLLTRTDPASTTAAPKVLTLAYRDAAGTHLAAGDAGKTFVSDLTSMTRPEGNATTFGLDARGNVTSRTDGEQNVAQTTFDAFGQIQTETDEVGNVTKYEQYDTNGMAQQIVAPRGVAADADANGGRWIYRYDDAGNTLSVTDPRAGAAATVTNPGTNFTTSMTYDALDRPTRTSAPKDSPSDNATGDPGDAAVINRDSVYDANDNITKRTDGERKETTATFTAMDAVSTVTTPLVPHGDTSAAETTRYVHDAVDNVIRAVSPRGESTTTDGDFETEYHYDSVDQRVAEIRRSTDPDQDPTLASSWAYDLRGNQVGMVDPRQNARFSTGTPEQNAQTPANRRYTYEYDKADNRTVQIEDPGGENDRSDVRYDRNDRIVAKVDPRGNEANADPDQFTWLYGYDGRDLLTSTDSPAVAHVGETGDVRRRTEYKRRDDGKIQSVIAPRGTATSAEDHDFETVLDYDADGNLKSRTLPRAPSQYGPPLTVSYARDAVGNPKRITDARRHSFANTFYDSGDLKSTARPSWWSYDDEAMSLQERTVEEITKANSAGDSPREQTAIATSDFGDVKPEPMPDWLPKAGDTTFGYDAEMRLTRVTDAANFAATIDHDALGRVTSTTRPFNRDAGAPASQRDIVNKVTYDFNGNILSQTDGQRTDGTDIVTRYGYDQYDRQTDETAPGANNGAEVTHSTYDRNGNVSDVQTPRGTHIASGYDRLDRLTSTTDGKGNRTSYDYDAAANKVTQTAPRGNVTGLSDALRAKHTSTWTYDGAGQMSSTTDGLGQQTTFGYDRNGNQARVTAPGAKAGPDDVLQAQTTVRTFDGRDLPWTTTTGTGSNSRTTITEFDGNGNPRRDVKPRGVNADDEVIFNDNYAPDTATTDFPALSDSTDVTRHATVREYDNDDLLKSIHMPWGPGDGDNGAPERKRYRMDFAHDSRGRVSTIDAPYEWSQAHPKAQRTKYGHYENGWVSSVSDQRIKNPAPGQTDPSFAPDHQHDYTYDTRGLQTDWTSDKGRRIHREFYDNKQLRSRSARASATDTTPRVYDYEYDKNGSLTKLIDPQLDGGRATTVTYDDADRPVRFNETWGGGRDTAYIYDEDSNVTTRKVDGQVTAAGGYTNGRITNFDFDEIGRETTMTVVVPDTADRVTKTEYWPSNQVSLRDRRAAKGAVERTYFNDDTRISRMTRDNQAATQVKNQTYTYDENANRTKDERGTHEYNARDQLTKWTRASTYPHPGTSVTYDLNAAGAILTSTDESLPASQQQTTYDYTEDQGPGLKFIGDRLIKSTQGGLTTNYQYNALGDITKIDAPEGADTDYTYDDFERRTKTTGPGETAGETYSYDALDRRDKRTKAGTTFDYSYVALTEKLSREKTGDGSDARTYDYDSGLRMQGQSTSDSTSAAAYRSYALDANGSVEGLEGASGGLADTDTYQYDPYGEIVNSTSLSTTAAAAPLRFEGFYLDSGVKTYDMQARSYRPDIGRFLSQDRFEAASGDLALQSDPLTQNRYAFAGGNPVSNVEWDGHYAVAGDYSTTADGKTYHQRTGKRVDSMPANRSRVRQQVASAGTHATKRDRANRRVARQNRTEHAALAKRIATSPVAEWVLGEGVDAHGLESRSPHYLSDRLEEIEQWEWIRSVRNGGGGGLGARDAAELGLLFVNPCKLVGFVCSAIGRAGSRAVGAVRSKAFGGASRGAAKGADIGGAKFAQKSFSENFGKGGLFEGRTIDDVAGALRSRSLSAKDVPINVVVRDGNTLILNTRSAQALTRAGVPRGSWNVVNRTGDDLYEGLLSGQLRRNRLGSGGTDLP